MDPRPRAARAGAGAIAAAIIALALAAQTGDATPRPTDIAAVAAVAAGPHSDSFAHARHQKVPCLSCHLSATGSKLTFERPRGCQSCHHSDAPKKECTGCHARDSLPVVIEHPVVIAAAQKPPRERQVAFRHERHRDLQCTACHGEPVTMLPVDSARTCDGCHGRHHEAGRQCALCHSTQHYLWQAHDEKPVGLHAGCSNCHSPASIAPLVPTRSFCLVCHEPALDHHPGHECTVCHMQATPEEYRQRLLSPPKPDSAAATR